MTVCPLVAILAQIPDPRKARGIRHPLPAILSLCGIAMLCGYRSYSAIAEWGRSYGSFLLEALGFRDGKTPCASTFCYLFRRIDIHAFEKAIATWAESIMTAIPPKAGELEAIAIDGKSLRGSRRQGCQQGHLLSALSQRLGLTIGQQAVEDKTNEIKAIQELLRDLVLEGRVITVDALLTQQAVAKTILEEGGDYFMVVKENQPDLHDDLAFLMQPERRWETKRPSVSKTELGHSRLEERTLTVSEIPETYPLKWPGAKQIVKLERTATFKKSGKRRHEVSYAITSLSSQQASPEALFAIARGHWSIENRLHWVRDILFAEDHSQVKMGHTPQFMAAMRNLVLNLMRASGITAITAATRRFAAQPAEALALLGATLTFE